MKPYIEIDLRIGYVENKNYLFIRPLTHFERFRISRLVDIIVFSFRHE